MCQGKHYKQLDFKDIYEAPPGRYWIDAGPVALRLMVTDNAISIEAYPKNQAGSIRHKLENFEIKFSDNKLKLTP